jgi:hypothetical protein
MKRLFVKLAPDGTVYSSLQLLWELFTAVDTTPLDGNQHYQKLRYERKNKMNKTRFLNLAPALFLGITLIALILVTYNPFPVEVSHNYAGMGDLHSFEVQQELQGTSPAYAGMGDLHRFEAGQVLPNP